MRKFNTTQPEETLDPNDWELMRGLGHRMIDDMMDYMKNVRERPVWQHAPDSVKAHFDKPLPLDPQNPEEIYDFLKSARRGDTKVSCYRSDYLRDVENVNSLVDLLFAKKEKGSIFTTKVPTAPSRK